MRGKVVMWEAGHPLAGITPAYAGKRIKTCAFLCCCRDHPRLCGEKPHDREPQKYPVGSPPPMRGKAAEFQVGRLSERITPAYAGKSDAFLQACEEHQDHPRLCGEKQLERVGFSVYCGSPPPMRGKGSNGKSTFWNARITPAYAGKRLKCEGEA